MSDPLPGTITQPPRFTGTVEQQMTQMINWVWDLFSKLELTNLFLRFAEQFAPLEFDPTSLPNPSTTTVAQAQQTANDAFILAASALSKLGFNGEFIIDELNTTVVETFADDEVNATYNVVATPVAVTGAPAAGAFTITKIDKLVSGFTVTFEAAPGAATSVTYDYQLRR